MKAGAPPGFAHAGRREQTDDPLPVPSPRLEQVQHPLVIGAMSGEGEAHLVREVVVADADRIGVAERTGNSPTKARIKGVER